MSATDPQGLDALVSKERSSVVAALAAEDSMVAGLERLQGDLNAGALPRWGEPSTGSSVAAKVVIAVLLLGGAAAAGWVARTQSGGTTDSPTVLVAAQTNTDPGANSPIDSPRALPIAAEDEGGDTAEDAASASPRGTDAAVPVVAEPGPERETETGLASPTGRSATKRARAPKPRKSSAPPGANRPATADDFAAQLGMLRLAESASREGRHRDVGKLVSDYRSRFPSRMFDEDMSALSAIAQCARADSTRATEKIVAAFARRYPASIHRARVRESCSDAK